MSAESDWQRRRRLAEVFGDSLPEGTRDDRDDGDVGARPGPDAGPAARESAQDAWLRAQVPPHHGG